ncbi:recombination regulator RecX [Cytobacillus firmus]|uniref:recombination regulator RecX n=1 Tax=Cytobacillus firmus TaxID=1399 RepID=UPI001C96E966|nr:recombination regulator RecX [Cytobacillus firmus]MBY6052069.1 recombination regulator RecX [Cytobacillus firmus]USK39976.1 recombination regulator RecX [Cytobacillus firmus]WHY62847.1 recombination regulator RecX [Cytobacillus firmus]
MPTITKITVQKNNTDRYNIYMDYGKGEEYAFSVDEDVLIKHQLKKGMELDEFSLNEIGYQDDIRKAYNRAIHYLSRRMRSETEVRKHLAEKEVEEPVIQEVIHKLYDYHFLNDEEFAAAFVRTQMNTSDKGKGLIRTELKEKGISPQLIEMALEEYPRDAELAAAIRLCEKYSKKYARDSSKILKQKLEQMLMRKGFNFDIIQEAVTETEIDKEEDEELAALRFQAEKAKKKYANLPEFEYMQKMKQALFRKGFSFDLIEQFLSEEE